MDDGHRNLRHAWILNNLIHGRILSTAERPHPEGCVQRLSDTTPLKTSRADNGVPQVRTAIPRRQRAPPNDQDHRLRCTTQWMKPLCGSSPFGRRCVEQLLAMASPSSVTEFTDVAVQYPVLMALVHSCRVDFPADGRCWICFPPVPRHRRRVAGGDAVTVGSVFARLGTGSSEASRGGGG